MRSIGFFLLLCGLASGTEPYMDSTKAALLIGAQESLLSEDYAEVSRLSNRFASSYPGDPAVYLMQIGSLMTQMSAAEENLFPKQFPALLDSLEEAARSRLELACDSTTKSWYWLLIGHSKAYRAIWQSKFGSTLSAVRSGMAANGAYKEGLKYDSSVYDHYLGIGTFRYWRTVKGGVLRWLGIIPNDRQEGIRFHHLAADSSAISKQAARTSLLWVWLAEESFDSVITASHASLAQYPNAAPFLWPLAEAYIRSEQFEAGRKTYEQIRLRYAVDPGNYFNLIECDYQICRAFESLGRAGEAELCARLVMGYADLIPDKTRDRQSDKLDYLRVLATARLAAEK